MVGEIGFETIFAFKYSPRPFTKAARFEGQIEESIKDERLARLFAFHDELARGLVEKYEGQILDVLVEGYDSKQGNMFGRSSQNKTVFFAGPRNIQDQPDGQRLIGQSVKIRITKAHPATLRGEWVQEASLG